MYMRFLLAALITLATVGYASSAHDAEGEEDVETLIKRLEAVFVASDLRKRDGDELKDLAEAVLKIEDIKRIKPKKGWFWNRYDSKIPDTSKYETPDNFHKNGKIPKIAGRR